MKNISGPWYVTRRAELLAELFIQYLSPDEIMRCDSPHAGWDYQLRFDTGVQDYHELFVESKATKRRIYKTYSFQMPAAAFHHLESDKDKVIFAVADVGKGELFYAWGTDLKIKPTSSGSYRCSGNVQPVNEQSVKELRKVILANKKLHRAR